MNQKQIIAIVVVIAAVALIAGAAALGNSHTPKKTSGYSGPSEFTVESSFANEYTDILNIYLESSNGSNSVCIDAAGTYNVPSDPVLKIKPVAEGFKAGVFGKQVVVYSEESGKDNVGYRVDTFLNGTSTGNGAIKDGSAVLPLTPNSPNLSFTSDAVIDYDSITCYVEDSTIPQFEYYYSHDVPAKTVLDPKSEYFPAGKTFSYWSYGDGDTTQITPGDSTYLPYGVRLFGNWA